MTNHNTGIPLVVRYDDRGRPNGFREEVNISVSSVSATTYYGIESITEIDINNLTSSGYPEGHTLQVGPSNNVIAVSSTIESITEIDINNLTSSGYPEGYILQVGPSSNVIAVSSTTVPIEGDPGKLQILNSSGNSVINASALQWDYALEQLNVVGDVSAQKFYGSSVLFNTNMPSDYAAVEGEAYYDLDAHTLSIQTGTNTTLQVGQEQVIHVRNTTGDTITDGTVVYVSGTQGTGSAKLLIGKATALVAEVEQDIVGIATQDIAHNSDGFITTFGVVRNISTAGTTVGDVIYLSTSAGKFTNVAPQAPNHTIKLGIVLRVHQNAGAVFVKVDPGFDLASLHDVSVQGIQSGDLLRWNGTIFAPSAYDHGTLGGLADDDHTQYVIKSNTTQARNTIQPNTDVPALTLQAGLSNTGRLLEIKNSLTQTVAYISIDGTIVTDGGLTVAGSKSFLIDHPTKEGMKLQYACLEGPENGVYVRGRATSEVIDLPDYWVGLVHEDSITVTLTPVGSAQSDLYVANIADNKVHLVRESNQPIDCFYIVNATRKDLENLVVEFSK
jgi:ribosomal protein L35AE/L33A